MLWRLKEAACACVCWWSDKTWSEASPHLLPFSLSLSLFLKEVWSALCLASRHESRQRITEILRRKCCAEIDLGPPPRKIQSWTNWKIVLTCLWIMIRATEEIQNTRISLCIAVMCLHSFGFTAHHTADKRHVAIWRLSTKCKQQHSNNIKYKYKYYWWSGCGTVPRRLKTVTC